MAQPGGARCMEGRGEVTGREPGAKPGVITEGQFGPSRDGASVEREEPRILPVGPDIKAGH